MSTRSFEAIGTHWHIQVEGVEDDVLFERIRDRIEEFDKAYSRFRSDSLVHEMSVRAGTYTLPEDAKPLFDLYADMYIRTRGAVTPLIGDTLESLGYDAQYSLTPRAYVAPRPWDQVLTYSYPTLTLLEPACIDVGAAGKGYLVDIVAEMLVAAGAHTYVVDAGGDIRVLAPEGMQIGLEHPERADEVIGVAHLMSGSLCGSAGNRRAWAGHTHIIDPKTGTSPTHIRAVWVVAETARMADMLTTGLFMAPVEAFEGYSFEYVVLYDDYTVLRSNGFPGELFTS